MDKFASVILRAAEIREESFDHKAADKAEKESNHVDFSKFYRKDLYEASEEASKEAGLNPEMAQPISLLLITAWNDILAWAKEQVDK